MEIQGLHLEFVPIHRAKLDGMDFAKRARRARKRYRDGGKCRWTASFLHATGQIVNAVEVLDGDGEGGEDFQKRSGQIVNSTYACMLH